MKRWRRIESRIAKDCRVFRLDEVRFEPSDGGPTGRFYVIDAPAWINVIPLTDDERVLLIRQYRFGTEEFTLEIPGGMCDPGESPPEAARRELHEETGYRAETMTEIGWVHPNPAIQNNRCHTYLARGLQRIGTPRPDPDEAFELIKTPLAEIPGLIAERKITHALVITAFHFLDLASR